MDSPPAANNPCGSPPVVNSDKTLIKIISWNVNGIRSVLRKDLWYPFIDDHSPDIICLQEVRANQDQFSFDNEFKLKYPHRTVNCHQTKKGYSGTAIFSKIKPNSISIPEFDVEGRVIVAEFDDYFLVNVYVPNGGSRFDYRVNEWDQFFREYLTSLITLKKVIVCGDFNIAHQGIDIYNPKIKNVAGVTPKERSNFKELLELFVDSFRVENPKIVKFTWWSNKYQARSKKRGWRIDYFLVSKDLDFMETDILDEVMGSDHCPIVLIV